MCCRSEEEEEEEEEVGRGEEGAAWVHLLASQEYGSLPLEERCSALSLLVHTLLDRPTIRSQLEYRRDEADRVRKQLWEEARVRGRCWWLLPSLCVAWPGAGALCLQPCCTLHQPLHSAPAESGGSGEHTDVARLLAHRRRSASARRRRSAGPSWQQSMRRGGWRSCSGRAWPTRPWQRWQQARQARRRQQQPRPCSVRAAQH